MEKLALSVQTMSKTLAAQGDRLEAPGGPRRGKWWRQLMGYVLTAVISVLVGFAATLGLTLNLTRRNVT